MIFTPPHCPSDMILSVHSLKDSIEALLTGIRHMGKFEIKYTSVIDEYTDCSLARDKKLAFLGIMMARIDNIIRYSPAKRIRVSLMQRNMDIILYIYDDGAGADGAGVDGAGAGGAGVDGAGADGQDAHGQGEVSIEDVVAAFEWLRAYLSTGGLGFYNYVQHPIALAFVLAKTGDVAGARRELDRFLEGRSPDDTVSIRVRELLSETAARR